MSILMTVAPPRGSGVVRPVSRRTCLTRRAQDLLTANVLAICPVFMPRSYAANTRSRRSCEYVCAIRGSFPHARRVLEATYDLATQGATEHAPNGARNALKTL
jgi:hypothetical protein